MTVPVRILLGQLAIGLAAAALWTAGAGSREGLSALSGGLIAVLSNGFFAARIFMRGRGDAQQRLRNFIAAEAMKLGLLVVMFAVAIRWFADSFLPLISTYAATVLVFLWALRWTDDVPARNRND
jgi:ATP synthase protein I